MRCSADDGTSGEVVRCQLLAGHGRVHAAMKFIDGRRRIVTWTSTCSASPETSLPADAPTASSFAWSVGYPAVEPGPETKAAATPRKRGHLRVVA